VLSSALVDRRWCRGDRGARRGRAGGDEDGRGAVLKITADLKEIDAAREQASGTDDQAWTGATDLLAQALGCEDVQAPYREAVRTPTAQWAPPVRF
jgi:hypothetical protein